ncbi:MAG: c-type cytochrome [Pseudomonadota bacterium]
MAPVFAPIVAPVVAPVVVPAVAPWASRVATIVAATVALLTGAAPAAAEGDVERGGALFGQCRACHAVGDGAANTVGPHLNGLFGRKAGGLEDAHYSQDMQRAGADGLVWDAETLDHFLQNPRSMVTRTRMSFRGIDDPVERRDLIAYLRTYSDPPRDIPEAAPTDDRQDPAPALAVLQIQGDPAYGAYLSGECVTCHQASGADDGIPSITGWPTEIFVTVMHAYKNKHRPHPVMQSVASNLADDEIAALAAYFEGL